jgi:hypothetical protein
LTLDVIHCRDDLFRAGGISDSPPGHGVGLGNSVDDDRLAFDLISEGSDARKSEIIVDDLFIDLIGDDKKIVSKGDLRDLFQISF